MSELRFDGSVYKTGKNECTTGVYGIRSRGFRDYLKRHYGEVESVYVSFDKPEFNCTVKLTDGYWRFCPELKDKKIKSYLESLGLLTWEKGNPPKFDVIPTCKNCRIVLRKEESK